MADNVTPTGAGGRSSGTASGSSGATAAGGATGSSNSGGASRSGDGNGSSGNSRPVANASVPVGGANPRPASGNQRPAVGRDNPSQGGVRPTSGGDNPRGSAGNGRGEQHGTGSGTEEARSKLDVRVDDAEEKPESPLFVGIPKATKAEKAATKPATPKGKAADVDEETVSLLVGAAFEVPAFVFQWITPLQGGHPWWSRPSEQCDKIAEPLTRMINRMSPLVKKVIKENADAAALVAAIANTVEEPIRMEIEVHRQIKEAKLAYLRGLPSTVQSNGASTPRRNQRPPSGLEGARTPGWLEESEDEFAGDTPI